MSTSPQPLSPAAILDLIHRNTIGSVNDVPVFSQALHTKIQPLTSTGTSVPPVVRSRAQQEALALPTAQSPVAPSPAIPGVRGGPNRRQTFGLSQTSGVFREDPTLVRDVPNSDGLVSFLRDRAERERSAAILRTLQQPAVVTVEPVVVATPHPVMSVPVTTTWQVIGEALAKICHGVFILCRAFMRWLIAQDFPTKTTQLTARTRTMLAKGMGITAKVLHRGCVMLGKGSGVGRRVAVTMLRLCGYGVMAGVSTSARVAHTLVHAFIRLVRAASACSSHATQVAFRAICRLDFSPLEFRLFAAIEWIVFLIPRALARFFFRPGIHILSLGIERIRTAVTQRIKAYRSRSQQSIVVRTANVTKRTRAPVAAVSRPAGQPLPLTVFVKRGIRIVRQIAGRILRLPGMIGRTIARVCGVGVRGVLHAAHVVISGIGVMLRFIARSVVMVVSRIGTLVRRSVVFILRLPVRLFRSLRRIRLVFPARKRVTWALGQAFTIGALVLTLMTVGPIVRLQAGSWWEQLQYTLTGKAKEPAIRENLLDAVRPPEVIPPEEKQFQLVIPKINANMKVIANVDAGNETEYSVALKKGVAHAKGSNLPGETEHGNRTIYIFGHSTNAIWNIDKYNALFYSLKDMVAGDDVSVWFWGKEYHYTVKNVVKIDPSDVHYLQPQVEKDQLILQTCWPPGTTWKRLLVIAEPSGE